MYDNTNAILALAKIQKKYKNMSRFRKVTYTYTAFDTDNSVASSTGIAQNLSNT